MGHNSESAPDNPFSGADAVADFGEGLNDALRQLAVDSTDDVSTKSLAKALGFGFGTVLKAAAIPARQYELEHEKELDANTAWAVAGAEALAAAAVGRLAALAGPWTGIGGGIAAGVAAEHLTDNTIDKSIVNTLELR